MEENKNIRADIINFINGLDKLDQKEKEKYIAMINEGQDPEEVLDKLEDALQIEILRDFQKAGIDITKNPEFQTAYKEMADEIKSAEAEYETSMSEAEKETDKIEGEGAQKIDNLKIEAIRSNISGKDS